MKTIWNFLQEHKYALFWTVGYVCVMWMVLFFLFNFDLFNMAQWQRLLRANLRGFPGFVFGLLILSAVPLYVATTVLIVRKKKPLITIPVPNVKLSFLNKKSVEPVQETKTEEKKEEQLPEKELPKDLPLELKPVFLRAQQNLLFMQQSGAELPTAKVEVPDVVNDVVDGLPVPADFDFSLDDEEEQESDFDMPFMTDGEAPVFKSVDFDAPNDSVAEVSDSSYFGEGLVDVSALVKYLTDKKQAFEIDEDVVLTDKYAIVTHSDKDFWVADTENWFAAGKVCESPVQKVKKMAQKYALKPVIYLQEQNILDVDKLIAQWQSEGIKVVVNLDDL